MNRMHIQANSDWLKFIPPATTTTNGRPFKPSDGIGTGAPNSQHPKATQTARGLVSAQLKMVMISFFRRIVANHPRESPAPPYIQPGFMLELRPIHNSNLIHAHLHPKFGNSINHSLSRGCITNICCTIYVFFSAKHDPNGDQRPVAIAGTCLCGHAQQHA
jgi:hypothetical protein